MFVCLRMVSFRVKIWVTYIVFLSNGVFRFQSERRPLFACGKSRNSVRLRLYFLLNNQQAIFKLDAPRG